VAKEPKSGLGRLSVEVCKLHTIRHTHTHTIGSTPLCEWSARHRGSYLHNSQQTKTEEWKIVFWVFPRRLNIKSRRFGTLCQFHLQQVMKCEFTLHHLLKMEPTLCSETSAFNTQDAGEIPRRQSFITTTRRKLENWKTEEHLCPRAGFKPASERPQI
jgi:hypothetical protein